MSEVQKQRPKKRGAARMSIPRVFKRWCPTCKCVVSLTAKGMIAHAKENLAVCQKCNSKTVPCRRPPRGPKPQSQAEKPVGNSNRRIVHSDRGSRQGSRRTVQKPSRSSMVRAMPGALNIRATNPLTRVPANTAVRRFLMSTINPMAALGSAPVKLKCDNMQIPRVAYKFDSVFTISLATSGVDDLGPQFKIIFHASPLIIATIWTDRPELLQVLSAKSVVDGNYIHVLGSKSGQLGSTDSNFFFTPAEDWVRYRCAGYSGQTCWVGREIDKSGTAYIARMADDNIALEDFDPTSKQDSIFTQAFKTISVSGQHKKPVYDFLWAESADDVDDTNNVHEREVEVVYTMSYDPTGSGQTGFIRRTQPVTPVQTFVQLVSDGANTLRPPTSQAALVAYLNEIRNAYPTFISVSPAGQLTIDCTLKYFIEVGLSPLTGGATKPVANAELELNTTANTMDALGTNIWTLIMADLNKPGRWQDLVPPGVLCLPIAALTFTIRVPRNYRRTQANIYSRNIFSSILTDELDGLFTDSSFSEPVIQFNLPQNALSTYAFQVIHTTNYELVVDDTSVLANYTLSEKETANNCVSMTTNKPLQTIMQSLPPAIIYDAGQLESTARTELASRGILSTIASILGPAAAAMFPEIAPIINPMQNLASALDTSLNI